MAQTQILAAGTTAATSTDVTLLAAAFANISAFTSGGSYWPANLALGVYIDTNGDDALVGTLTQNSPRFVAQGPGVYRVRRPVTPQAIGVTSDA